MTPIEKLKELLASATPEPWVASGNGVHHGIRCVATTHQEPREQRVADARFIATFRDIGPEVIAVLDAALKIYHAPCPSPSEVEDVEALDAALTVLVDKMAEVLP